MMMTPNMTQRPIDDFAPKVRRRHFRFVFETHRQCALGIAICQQDVHVAIGPFVAGFEWPIEDDEFAPAENR